MGDFTMDDFDIAIAELKNRAKNGDKNATTTGINIEAFENVDNKFFTLPSEMEGYVPSEEYTGTLPVSDQDPGVHAGRVTGFNDPVTQGVVGLVKGGNVVQGALEDFKGTSPDYGLSIKSLIPGYSVMEDPGRILDKVTPLVNAGIGGAEWLANKGEDFTNWVSDTEGGPDIELPRVTGEFGSYPERGTSYYKDQLRRRYQREQFVRNYEEEFNKKNESAPYIAEVLSYAPDIMTALWGGATWLPKISATVEGSLSGSRAGQDGQNVAEAKIFGSLGGYGGAKLSQWMQNSLSPKELAIISSNMKDPLVKESTIAMLKYFEENPNIQRSLINSGKTGNAVLDGQIDFMREQMGRDSFDLFTGVLDKISKDGKATLKGVAEDFSASANEKYDALSKIESDNWDEFLKSSDLVDTVSTSKFIGELDSEMENAPMVIKNFTTRLMQNNSNELAIKSIKDAATELFADYQQKYAGATTKEKKALTKAYRSKLKQLNYNRAQLEGEQSSKALNLTAEDIINKIKLINDKKYLKGSSINSGNRTQSRYLGILKKKLEDQLEGMEGFDKFDPLYKKAKNASKEKFETFGYGKSGSNMGKKVGTPELGQVIGQTTAEQMKILEGVMNETPAVFAEKMAVLDKTLTKADSRKMRQYYVEKKLNNSLVDSSNVDEFSTLEVDRTLDALSKFTSTKDGRDLIINSFDNGEVILNNLLQIEGLTKYMKTVELNETISPSTFKAYVTQLGPTIKNLLSGQISDFFKTRRMLEGYGEKVGFNLAEVIKTTVVDRAIGTAVGGIVAPEGSELEGMALGGLGGKAVARGKLLNKIPYVNKLTKKLGSKAKSLNKKTVQEVADESVAFTEKVRKMFRGEKSNGKSNK